MVGSCIEKSDRLSEFGNVIFYLIIRLLLYPKMLKFYNLLKKMKKNYIKVEKKLLNRFDTHAYFDKYIFFNFMFDLWKKSIDSKLMRKENNMIISWFDKGDLKTRPNLKSFTVKNINN